VRRLLLLIALVVTTPVLAFAQSDASAYQKPPQVIVDIMDAAPLPGVALSPSRDVIALVPRRSMPIAELAKPWVGLAGERVDPSNNGPRGFPGGTGITLKTIATAAERTIQVPAGAHVALIGFSPNGRRLAFTDTRATRIDLYVAEVATGVARKADAALNTIVSGCGWLTDSSALLCPFVATDRGAPPAAPAAPSGPNIQETRGPGGPIRTFQDLLTSAHDEQLFEYYASSQLALTRQRAGSRSSANPASSLAPRRRTANTCSSRE
jgi:dipeptidyl aminopeptidase/acylaminoacyl peptidase